MSKVFQSCRLCRKEYLSESECRHNIFKTKKAAKTIHERLFSAHVEIYPSKSLSCTICRTCYRDIDKLEIAGEIKKKWDYNLEESCSSYVTDKRVLNLTPTKMTPERKKQRRIPLSNISNTISSARKELIPGGYQGITNADALPINQSTTDDDFLKIVADKCRNEMGRVEKISTMKDISIEALLNFDDKTFSVDIELLCPTLCAALKGAAGLERDSIEKFGGRTLCYGILFKSRYPRNRPCIVSHRNDQLLIAAGLKKKAFVWLNRMGFCNSYSTALNKNKQLSENHDEEVIAWKNQAEQALSSIADGDARPETPVNEQKVTEYQIVGDNLDFEMQARHQSRNNTNSTIHWFNVMAVKGRVHSSQNTKTPDYYNNYDVLPGRNTQALLTRDFTILIARSIVTFLPAFKICEKLIPWHIEHQFTKEVTMASEVIPLGLIFKSENSSSEMIEILRELQSKYVPLKKIIREDGIEDDEVAMKIPFGGDQLTEERAINVQKALLDGETTFERLAGLQPKIEDWHLKRYLYAIKDLVFRKKESGAEHGTSEWSMNVLGTTNAKKGPEAAYNAYKEFNDKETDAEIVAATMVHFNMNKVTDDPVPNGIKHDNEQLKEWFMDQVSNIIAKFVVTYGYDEFEKINEHLDAPDYPCRYQHLCGHKNFKYKKARDSHEKNVHEMNVETTESETSAIKKEDHKFNYMKASLTFNLLLRDINDSIREGDGERLLEIYKVALLYLKCYHHTKYAYTLIKLFFRIRFEPQSAFQLTWERFVNTKGKKGHNISLDLHLEHLNGFLKGLLKNLNSNLNESNAARISKSMGKMKKITEQMKENFEINSSPGYRKNPSVLEDIWKLASELKLAKVFEESADREFESFPGFSSDLLTSLNMDKLSKWVKDKREEFEQLYTLQQ